MSFKLFVAQMKQAWQFETVGGCMHALHAALAFLAIQHCQVMAFAAYPLLKKTICNLCSVCVR